MARFYFRPRTPMTHNNEGFRTHRYRDPEAYCPMPIALVFPSLPILTAEGTEFSDGNCATSGTRRAGSAAFLESLPFADIYHDSSRPPGEAGERIKHRRQSEILVPSPFDIRRHRFQIRVRSAAERETLLTSLRPQVANRYRGRVQVATRAPLFHRLWSLIESVKLVDEQLTIRFNALTEDRSKFDMRFSILSLDGRETETRSLQRDTVNPLTLLLNESAIAKERFGLRIELEGNLAYSGVLDPRPQMIFGAGPRRSARRVPVWCDQ